MSYLISFQSQWLIFKLNLHILLLCSNKSLIVFFGPLILHNLYQLRHGQMIRSHFLCSISPAPMILPSRATPTSLAPPLSTTSSHIDGNRSLSIKGQTFQTEKIMLMEMSLSFKPELCNYDKAPIGAGQLLCQCPYWSDVHHLLWGEIKPPTSTCSFPSSLCESL